jgi:molecular chaperone DnaK (HSP70)
VADPAERVVVSVYEGDTYDDPDHPENVRLAEIPWEFDPPRPQAEAAIEVTYEYGDDGILLVSIYDPGSGRRRRYPIQHAGNDSLSPQQAERLQETNEQLLNRSSRVEASTAYRDALEALRKAEMLILPKLEGEDKTEMADLCRGVRQAMGAGDLPRLDETTLLLSDRLLNYAHLL